MLSHLPLKILGIGLMGCLLFITKPVMAGLGLSAAHGTGSERSDAYRLSFRLQWPRRWFDEGTWYIGGYWDTSLGYWSNDIKPPPSFERNAGATHEIWVVSVTPVLRWQPRTSIFLGMAPFLETGAGVSRVSNQRLASKGFNPSEFGTYFQFETRVGVGLLFGKKQKFEFKVTKYHYSNAGLAGEPNNGMDLTMFSYGYWF